MKVLYIAEKYNPKYFSQGVERKIESQAKAMTKFGVSVDIQLFSRLNYGVRFHFSPVASIGIELMFRKMYKEFTFGISSLIIHLFNF